MPVNFESPSGADRWLIAEADGKPQLGAFMPAATDPDVGADKEPNLTVFWHGDIATTQLRPR
jgi:hypothetical protein